MSILYLDFETEPIEDIPDGRYPRPVGMAYAVDDGTPVYLAWGHPTGNNCKPGNETMRLLTLRHHASMVVCHNIGFDVSVVAQHMGVGLAYLVWHDTQVMAFHNDPHAFQLGLKPLAEKYLDMPPDEQDDVRAWLREHKIIRSNQKEIGAFLHLAPGDLVGRYAVGDIVRTRGLFKLWRGRYEQDEGYLRDMKATRVGLKMTARGVLLDRRTLDRDLNRAEDAYAAANRRLGALLGMKTYDPNQRDAVATALETRLGIDLPLTATGRRQTNKDALDAALPDGEVKALMRYSGAIGYDLKNYLRPWQHAVERTGGLIHPTWSVTRSDSAGARCMPAGELVLTSRGYLPVERVVVGDRVIGHSGRMRSVVATHQNGVRPVLRVGLSNGLILRVTANHQFLSDGDWIRADHLAAGMMVTVHSGPEQWRPVAEYPDYEVSSWGRVNNKRTCRIATQWPKGRWGHLKVCLLRNGAQKRGVDRKDFAVHRLVAAAFELPGTGPEVGHCNGIAWDNTVDNLKWCTSLQNRSDSVKHGTLHLSSRARGKLTDEAVAEIRCTPSGAEYNRAFAEKYGVGERHVRDIRNHKRWPDGVVDARCAKFRVSNVLWVVPDGIEPTYGLEVETDHSHVTGGIVTHNTGRLSSSPNFQNLRGEEGTEVLVEWLRKCHPGDYWTPQIRGCVVASGRRIIVGRDWSQIELRITAHYENGPMAANYRTDPTWDLHDWVRGRVKAMFNVDLIRRIAKNIGFGSIYGGGAGALAKQAKISTVQAAEFRTMYFEALPSLKELMDEVQSEARMRAITTLGGRAYKAEQPRFDREQGRWMEFYYKMLNYLIQGSAADLMKEAMIDADEYGAELILTVHDEPVTLCDDSPSAVEETLEMLRVAMEHNDLAGKLTVPIISDGYAVKRWSDADQAKKLYAGM